MKYQTLFKRILGVGLIFTLLMGCGAPATQASTLLPPTSALTTPIISTSLAASPVEFVWRIKGKPYRLNRPAAMAFDAQDNLYVIDGSNNRIQKFDRDGKFLLMWGGYGSADGQFIFRNYPDHPGAIAVDSEGLVYVADYNGFVQIFDGQGKFLRKWGGGNGTGDGQFVSPRCMGLDHQGNVYIADESARASRVEKFNAQGNFLMKWDRTTNGTELVTYCLAVDSQDNVYVVNPSQYRIEKYDSDSHLLTMWGSQGSGDGQFTEPSGIAVDAQGNVYVTDNRENYRVEKFDSDGKFLGKWGNWGSDNGQFEYPFRIAIDSQGNIYVTDDGDNDSIQKFLPH
jgi:DNA-binding beta-propeller fold protein YncE